MILSGLDDIGTGLKVVSECVGENGAKSRRDLGLRDHTLYAANLNS